MISARNLPICAIVLLMLPNVISAQEPDLQSDDLRVSTEGIQASTTDGIDLASDCDSTWDGALFGILPGFLVGALVGGFVFAGYEGPENYFEYSIWIGGTAGAGVGYLIDRAKCS